MDRNKVVIVCLILIAILFFVGLAIGLVQKKHQGVEKNNSREKENRVASDYGKKGWVKMMDRLFAPFATPLDINRLTFSCKRSGNTFYLTQKSPSCKITIPKSDENYRKGKLHLRGRGVIVKIEYKPADKKAEASEWPSKNGGEDSVRLVVFEAGGTVNLKCLHCDDGKHRSVRVKIE